MKTITVTTLRSINYGAVLQAYALHRFLSKLKIDNQLLDYARKTSIYSPLTIGFRKIFLIQLVQNVMTFFNRKAVKQMYTRFDSFISTNLSVTKHFDSYDELLCTDFDTDAFITGSDQVFGLRGAYDKIRTLQFVSSRIPCYSYAASLGEYDWNSDEKVRFSNILKGYEAVSVREIYAKQYLESFIPIECKVHIDPVFLLTKEEWVTVGSKSYTKKFGKYILCYPLVGNHSTQELIDKLKKQTGYNIVCVLNRPIKSIKADFYCFDAGPAELISLILNSEVVVTTSFHGTALSILFERPFYTLIKEYKSQRMTDLLKMMNLSNRIYSGQELTLDINFLTARERIAIERQKSTDYLLQLFQSIKR